MHTTKLRKVGGSVMLSIPPALLDVLHLSENTQVGLAIDNGQLVVKPQISPNYTLEELLAQCNPSDDLADEDVEWFDAKPVGRELL
ncbi:AbrB/MazE/SpoVT family DNA-binding domain-containing protein [Bartonella sp. MM73XJBT]|uniref:AbrB/MazE/SpoVT family DNA-binding domain-containing protein n=1 Tax=Bartonella sp. MM73XJBT TaxID=3019095 RepID=UPI002360D480|nr:AbrB/MazE/SpoVT family DNA-binding domain-containing protein [Bartonella sp. MM73XJBT]